ncbi:V-snare-domain-containing protein [Ascobolus immersus RN42]|uniref:V-snare-domain-containing protein n=1 Tax=Ascobolus immersus RN42 TaxID=1160509 RepID=A0A3N4HPW4_ASCIM|nr:V-snare-domain-containing protein [Ascobolus immersus RN42]
MSNPLDTDPGSELFASNESDFTLLQAEISQKLETLNDNSVKGEERKALLRNIERSVDEANEILSQMKLELQNIPSNVRSRITPRFRNHQTSLDRTKSLLKKLQSAFDGPYGGRVGSPGLNDSVYTQRDQLLGGTERLERSSGRLRDSHRIAMETEAIGAGILGDLQGQREQLQNTARVLNDSENYVDRSVKTIRGMSRRMATNRIITIAIITLLVLLIIAVIVNKFR